MIRRDRGISRVMDESTRALTLQPQRNLMLIFAGAQLAANFFFHLIDTRSELGPLSLARGLAGFKEFTLACRQSRDLRIAFTFEQFRRKHNLIGIVALGFTPSRRDAMLIEGGTSGSMSVTDRGACFRKSA